MENLYPLFKGNRILKKELLWSLRDYSFAHIQLEYQEYADGIICGCDLEVRETELCVGKGIVKHGGFIYLITEEMTIPYKHTGKLEILKMHMTIDRRSEDYIQYQIELLLDQDLHFSEDTLEVCRFKLKEGAKLRSCYQSFLDMGTLYDTLNYIDAAWSGLRGATLSPLITRNFAEAILVEKGSSGEDIRFAYLCQNQSGAVPRGIIEHYITMRLGTPFEQPMDNHKLFDSLNVILKEICSNKKMDEKRGVRRHQILVE